MWTLTKPALSAALLEWCDGSSYFTKAESLKVPSLRLKPRSEIVVVWDRLSLPGVNGERPGKSTMKRGE